jgi:hypothetical protein
MVWHGVTKVSEENIATIFRAENILTLNYTETFSVTCCGSVSENQYFGRTYCLMAENSCQKTIIIAVITVRISNLTTSLYFK